MRGSTFGTHFNLIFKQFIHNLYKAIHALFTETKYINYMKARKYIGGAIAIIGITAAVSVADGSAYEMLIRGGGIALLIVGAFIAKLFDFQNKKA